MKNITIQGKTYKVEQTIDLNRGDKCVAQIKGVWWVLTFVETDWVWDSYGYAFEEYPFFLRFEEHKIHKIINN